MNITSDFGNFVILIMLASGVPLVGVLIGAHAVWAVINKKDPAKLPRLPRPFPKKVPATKKKALDGRLK